MNVFFDTPLLLRNLAGKFTWPDLSDTTVTGILNVYEGVHGMLLAKRPDLASRLYERFAARAISLDRPRIFAASEFRIRQKSRGFSYADAAGYVSARQHGALFVTTDKAFRGLPGTKVLPR